MYRLARFLNKTRVDFLHINFLVLGLGNPGAKYSGTRHNAGFMAADQIGAKLTESKWRKKRDWHVAEGELDGIGVAVAKPLTFMNLSGVAAEALLKQYGLKRDKLIVFYDDVALPAGKIRIREKGSCGGHNGVRSVIDYLDSDEFVRVRIGVGKPDPDTPLVDYVLQCIPQCDLPAIQDAVSAAPEILSVIMREGSAAAMSKYN